MGSGHVMYTKCIIVVLALLLFFFSFHVFLSLALARLSNNKTAALSYVFCLRVLHLGLNLACTQLTMT